MNRTCFDTDEFGVGADLGLVTRGTPEAWATFSPDEVYRYALARVWNPDAPLMVGCFLNPSTATHDESDPTLRRFCHFARRESCGGIYLGNAFAFRATDPRELLAEIREGRDPVGQHNDEILRRIIDGPVVALAVAGWGAPRFKALAPRISRVKAGGFRRRWHCWGVTADGHPRHPLYLHNETPLVQWTSARGVAA